MALKSKKAKQSSPNKEATSTKPWPDFPKQLLSIVARQSTMMKNFSYGGVTKSWRAPPRRCNPAGKPPPPQLSDDGDNNRCHDKSGANVFDIPFRVGCLWWFGRKPPSPYFGCQGFVGYSHGVLVARGVSPPGYYLWDPVERFTTWSLPDWDPNIPFKFATLSSSPRDYPDNCVVMVLTGIHHPAFAFYRLTKPRKYVWFLRNCTPVEYAWFQQDCTLVDPYSSNQQLMQFTNAIGFEGKFYALSLQGTLAVIEDIDSCLRITDLGTSRAVPSVSSMHFKEFLIESNEEILLVFIISRKSIKIVDAVEVYRLQFARLSWVKMESLGDRTLFVGTNCCMSVTASEVGCRRNCIYFTHQTVDHGWWVFDMDRGSISPSWNTTDSPSKSPVWEEPIAEE